MKRTERPDTRSLIVEDDASRHLESLTMEERMASILQADSFVTTDEERLCHCSFCGKSQKEVRVLIAGPTVFICDECIDLCKDIVAEQPSKTAD